MTSRTVLALFLGRGANLHVTRHTMQQLSAYAWGQGFACSPATWYTVTITVIVVAATEV
jgi:hypothetical protein